ncbi:MAG: ketoacyl-ACP synthase III [Hungatella hathewayi]|nr:ketoacyl-ACP synthase III [Hungatella hathewayi]
MTAKIIGTGSAVPAYCMKNNDFTKFIDTSDEWIVTRTGIKERRIAKEETTAGLACEAARKALQSAKIKAEEIDLILVATCSPDTFFPSTACQVQAALGAENAAAFDMSAACAGFLFGLNTAYAYINSGVYKKVLVIGADIMTRFVDWKDRGTCVLFGDGAGAVVLEASETGLFSSVQYADGSRGKVLSCSVGYEKRSSYLQMDGQEVFKFAVKKVPECVRQVLEESGTDIEEIKYFVMHQANYRIFESIAKRLKVSMERIPMNMDRYGNTSGASVPIMLDELNREGKLQPGDKLILSGFGAGLTWGATLIEW